jgi:hypothetical protein
MEEEEHKVEQLRSRIGRGQRYGSSFTKAIVYIAISNIIAIDIFHCVSSQFSLIKLHAYVLQVCNEHWMQKTSDMCVCIRKLHLLSEYIVDGCKPESI